MVRPSKTLDELLDDFVCVRVTDMRGVDLSRFDFDFDLTFSALMMSGEGRVYHRYGGRDERGAGTWLSEASLASALRATLGEHEAQTEAAAPRIPAPLRLEEVASFKKRDRGECIHCHSVNTSLYEEARDAKQLTRDWIWKHPTPARIGLDLDRDDQRLVSAVAEDGAAAKAELKVGDRLITVAGTSIATASDVMFALDRTPGAGGKLAVEFERGGERGSAELVLAEGWKRGAAREFAWRPTKWAMTPAPGFGGPRLESQRLEALGLDPQRFAFRVQYLVTWGDNRRYGQAAAKAGLREGDIVTSVGGKHDFESIEHFHAWWRLSVEVGDSVVIETLRNGEPREVKLTAIR